MASRPVCDNCNVPHDMSRDAEGKVVTCMATGSRWAPRVEWACKSFERKAKETLKSHDELEAVLKRVGKMEAGIRHVSKVYKDDHWLTERLE
jgi:hypothetical protein